MTIATCLFNLHHYRHDTFSFPHHYHYNKDSNGNGLNIPASEIVFRLGTSKPGRDRKHPSTPFTHTIPGLDTTTVFAFSVTSTSLNTMSDDESKNGSPEKSVFTAKEEAVLKAAWNCLKSPPEVRSCEFPSPVRPTKLKRSHTDRHGEAEGSGRLQHAQDSLEHVGRHQEEAEHQLRRARPRRL